VDRRPDVCGDLRARFAECDLVVFGHSHIPMDVSEDGFRIVNPGSPTDRRRQPHGTLAVLQVSGGSAPDVQLIEVT
jgi:predicted phosphodiesterase